MNNMIFIFTQTKLKRKIIFVALRINKKFTLYCDQLSIETKKSQMHTPPPSTQLRYNQNKKNILFFKYELFELIKFDIFFL